MDELIGNPSNVLRLWGKAPAADDKTYAQRQREAHVARVSAAVRDGTYDEAPGLDVAAGKLVDLMDKPDLAERERAAFDELNDPERWDGLS